jgi:serine/threonine-protein kinase
MSPEQVSGAKSLDARADIYALGVILYECAAAQKPFEADTLPHLAVLIHQGQPALLSTLRPDLPPAFVELVQTAMASDRQRRFASARDLRAALEAFRGGQVPFDVAPAGDARGPVVITPRPESIDRSQGLGPTMVGGSAVSVANEKKGSGAVLVGIGLAIAVLLGVGFAVVKMRTGAGDAAAKPTAVITPAPPAAGSAAATAPPTATEPAALPQVAAASTPDAAAEPVEPQSQPAHGGPAASAPPRPAPKSVPTSTGAASAGKPQGAPSASSAAPSDQKGLANDNPFK